MRISRWIAIVWAVAMVLAIPAVALAQEVAADELPANINPTSLRGQLTTIAGIAALSLLLVQVVKWGLARYHVGIVSELPTPVFVVIVGAGLTILANLVLKTLPGDLLDLLWQGFFASGMASAVFSWIKNGMGSPADKAASTALPLTNKASWLGVLLLPLVLATGGCGQMSPGQQYVIASHSYATTMNVLSGLRDAGMFTTADRKLITQLSDNADLRLDEMAQAILDGKTIGLPYMLGQINAVLDDLLTIQLQAQADQKAANGGKAATKPPATTQQAQPAGKALTDGHNNRDSPGTQSGDGAVDGFRQCPGSLAANGTATAGGTRRLGDGDSQDRQGPLGRWRAGQPIPLTALLEVEWD